MFFDEIQEALPDPIFGLIKVFNDDPRKEKVNLSLGIYKTEELKPVSMRCVEKVQSQVSKMEKEHAYYLPLDGDPEFIEETGKLVFGKSFWSSNSGRIYGAQTVGGTGALWVSGVFLLEEAADHIYLPDPTWANHKPIFERANLKVGSYFYYDHEKSGFDFEKMHDSISKLPEKSIVLMHGSCHNPTGCDPIKEEWEKLFSLLSKKKIMPFFDLGYQGFGRGVEKDAEAIRYFAEQGHEMVVNVTYSKNFSLYCQRVGSLFVLSEDKGLKEKIKSQIKRIIRSNYSNPPAHGAYTISTILKSPGLRKDWEEELKEMRTRLSDMRNTLVDHLAAKSCPVDFSFLKKRLGMFCFCDLKKEQVKLLAKEYGIYMPASGRINVAGLNKENIDYVTDSILSVIRKSS